VVVAPDAAGAAGTVVCAAAAPLSAMAENRITSLI
jgi:hypothetical protein